MTEKNPLVASGEYVRTYACEVEPGDYVSETEDTVVSVQTFTDGCVSIRWDNETVTSYRRDTTLLVKASSREHIPPCPVVSDVIQLMALSKAARSLWDEHFTLADAETANPEYLRAQVETIMRVTNWHADVDCDEQRGIVTAFIFSE